MSMIKYKHHTIISREVGYDEYDKAITSEVYSGPCLYEEGGSNRSYRYYTRNPLLFLPENDALVNINDVVEVHVEKGRVIKAIVRIPRDIDYDGLKCTRLELKLAEDEELEGSQQ